MTTSYTEILKAGAKHHKDLHPHADRLFKGRLKYKSKNNTYGSVYAK